MPDRSEDTPKGRKQALLTLEDYIKQYAHPLDKSERRPRAERVEDDARLAASQELAVDEGAVAETGSEPAQTGTLPGAASPERAFVADEDHQEPEQPPRSAFETGPIQSRAGTKRLGPDREESSRLRREVALAGQEALAALRAELVHAQEELARTREQTRRVLRAEVKKLVQDADREVRAELAEEETVRRRAESGVMQDAAEPWHTLQVELLRIEIEVLNREAQALCSAGELPPGERRELLQSFLARVDAAEQRLGQAQEHVASQLSEVQAEALERKALDAVAGLQQEVEGQKADLSELAARVSARDTETPRSDAKQPRSRQDRRVLLLVLLALVLVAAVSAAGVVLPRDSEPDPAADAPEARLLVELSTLYQSTGQTENAVRLMDEAMATGIYDPGLLGQVGEFYQAMDEHEKAIRALDRAVKTHPDDPELRFALARSQQSAGYHQQALDLLVPLIKSEPGNWRYHAEAGHSYLGLGDTVRALVHFERMLAIDPNMWQGYAYKGNVYFQLEQCDTAISYYEKAVEINPGHYDTWLFMARCYASRGDLDNAIQGYQAAIAIAPEQAKAHFYLGQAYLEQERFADAVEPYQRAIELRPQWIGAHLDLGKVYLNLDDCERARKHFERVLGVEPEHAEARDGMAACAQE